MIFLGVDPGLNSTGWGVISAVGNRLSHVAHGQIGTRPSDPLAFRLALLFDGLTDVILEHQPAAAAVEETFLNKNPQSTLKLGHARGAALVALARAGIEVGEYSAKIVKKSIVGTGNAEKQQVHAMICRLLPGTKIVGADASDALAVAICHAHHLASARSLMGAR